MGVWRAVVGVAVGLSLVGLSLVGLVPAAAAAPVAFHDAAGIHVVAVRRIDDRQLNVAVSSAALGRAVDVRILLPAGYASGGRFPTLYLFHGTSGRASDWVTQGDAERTTASERLITVMPDAGFDGDGGGWFTDWVDTGTVLGPSKWETFHVAQLIPWVDANLHTIAARRGRAIAGLSQGGFGAMTYAARHPDTFVAAGSFSGAPEIDHNPAVTVGATAVVEATAYGLDRVEPEAMFGSRVTREVNWQGHDPSTIITNLRGMSLSLWTASGLPGPYDKAPNPGASLIEALTHASTSDFHAHLQQVGIPSLYDDYVYGTHTWPYWTRDLRQFMVPLMAAFAQPPSPVRVSYMSIDRRWSQWGWSVAIQRSAVQEFSSLTDAGPDGFVLAGSGRATVTTPAVYPAGSSVSVSVAGAPPQRLAVDGSGRLTLVVDLSRPARVTISRSA